MNIKKHYKEFSSKLLVIRRKVICICKRINWFFVIVLLIFPFTISLLLFPRSIKVIVPVQGDSFFSMATSTYIFYKPSDKLENIITKIFNTSLSIGSYKLCLYNGSSGTRNKLSLGESELNALSEYDIGIEVYPYKDNFDQEQKRNFLNQLSGRNSTNTQPAKTFSRTQLVGLISIVAKAGQTSCGSISFDQNGFIFSVPSYNVIGGPMYSSNGPIYSKYNGVEANLEFQGGTNKYTANIASTSVFMTTDPSSVWINRILLIVSWVTFILIIIDVFGCIKRKSIEKE